MDTEQNEAKTLIETINDKERQMEALQKHISALMSENGEIIDRIYDICREPFLDAFQREIVEPLRHAEGTYWQYKDRNGNVSEDSRYKHIIRIDKMKYEERLFEIIDKVVDEIRNDRMLNHYIGFCYKKENGDLLDNFKDPEFILNHDETLFLNPFNYHHVIDRIIDENIRNGGDLIIWKGLSVYITEESIEMKNTIGTRLPDLGRNCVQITKEMFDGYMERALKMDISL